MASDFQQFIANGYVGHIKPDYIKELNNGSRMASFSIAVNEEWKDKKTGEVHKNTEWVNIVTFQKGLVNLIEERLQKGQYVLVTGVLRTRKWQNQYGETKYFQYVEIRYKHDFVILRDSNNGSQQSNEQDDPVNREAPPDDIYARDGGVQF